MTGSEKRRDRKFARPWAVALGVLGVLTFVAAVLLLLLVANARDFCDSTCNQGASHVWAVLLATAIASSLVQVFAAIGGSQRLAFGAFAVTFLIAGIVLLPLIITR